MMDDSSCIPAGELSGIKFGLATTHDIRKASSSDFPITHASQLVNSYLGLPIASGKCATCGTAEAGECDGHFGFIELPVPVYHPVHVGELCRMLNLLCLSCLRTRKNKLPMVGSNALHDVLHDAPSCCKTLSKLSVNEVKNSDGTSFLELKVPINRYDDVCDGDIWNFLRKYGYRYGGSNSRPLLPSEVLEILRRIPIETRKKLSAKGFFPQDGYILRYLPVPPNCLSIPEISDSICIISSDISVTLLKKVMKQVEIIRRSRSGEPNFEAHEVEVNDLQTAVMQYLQMRGASKSSRDVDGRSVFNREPESLSTKAWFEKIKTLFIRKGSGFSSRGVITGDAYRGVNEIGVPYEISQKITFEEQVNVHNIKHLQKLVDDRLCVCYKDGLSTFSLREGSKGHTFLRVGQVLQRRIMDGDIVFVNRPPSTHKHSLQAFSIYIHEDKTVKINPLICGPFSADFDGDCVHLFYPQSLASRAEVMELFLVEKQLLSSHTGRISLQVTADSLLSLVKLFQGYFFEKAPAQQLAMFSSNLLHPPAILKALNSESLWTALQIMESVSPVRLDVCETSLSIAKGKMFRRETMRAYVQAFFKEVVTLILLDRGHEAIVKFFNDMQPVLMEFLFTEGYSLDLKDFVFSKVKMQKAAIDEFILWSSRLGGVTDTQSDSGMHKVVQQLACLGLQLSEGKKYYSQSFVEGIVSLFRAKCKFDMSVDSRYGFVHGCFLRGLNPFEEMIHSIAAREVIVCSRGGLSEPGTLFKNLMAMLRDVIVCYDGTVRNICSNFIVQFKYGITAEVAPYTSILAGEPVGVLAATAMSNPAYKAVLDSSPGSSSLWEMMKEVLLCNVAFKNDHNDRRIILYLKSCGCGRQYCQEKAAYQLRNFVKKVDLKDVANNFFVKYEKQIEPESSYECLVAHIHLNKELLDQMDMSGDEVLEKCQSTINCVRKKKGAASCFSKVFLSSSDCCSSDDSGTPCVKFCLHKTGNSDIKLSLRNLSDVVCPVILGTVIKGDPRISSVDVISVVLVPTSCEKKHPKYTRCEIALDFVVHEGSAKKAGDAWGIVMDSCLPLIHLIDTRRSIPYAVKAVQKLLGISCAFDQAVQRLSRSVSMVSKDILKEHLILLANTMTCCGELVGFNVGGYRTLLRKLDTQVPLTEATLFAPRRCFERAAEKCHKDSLSSIVASCSWGKHVAVGTGSRFDLMWEDKLERADLDECNDVYAFLNLVQGGSSKNDSITSCLGAEIENLAPDEERMDFSLSPDYDAQKPIFDDDVESYLGAENSGYCSQNVQDQEEKRDACGWEQQVPFFSDRNNELSSWEQKNVESKNNWDAGHGMDDAVGQCGQSKDNVEGQWGQDSERPLEGQCGQSKDDVEGQWGQSSEQPLEGQWGQSSEQPLEGQWGQNVEQPLEGQWGQRSEPPLEGQWGQSREHPLEGRWGQSSEQPLEGQWGQRSEPPLEGQWGQSREQPLEGRWGQSREQPLEGRCGQSREQPLEGRWGQNVEQPLEGHWGQRSEPPLEGQWGHSHEQPLEGRWGQSSEQPLNGQWGQNNEHPLEGQWSQRSEQPLIVDQRNEEFSMQNEGESIGEWGQRSELPVVKDGWNGEFSEPKSSKAWDSRYGNDRNECDGTEQWGQRSEAPVEEDRGNEEFSMPKRSNAWDSPYSQDGNEGDCTEQWIENSSGSKCWPSDARNGMDRKRKNWRPKASRFGDDSNMAPRFTATRQRMDAFTSEEQNILSDVERLSWDVRRIMRETMDGNPLSEEDQLYIIDNVLAYHPNKNIKIGSGLEYVTVRKHSTFEESRCLYIVSTDGGTEDFSYLKCLVNLVRMKYPDLAESFIAKYFENDRYKWIRGSQEDLSMH